MAGSLTNPSARLATVMPSWQAATLRFRSVIAACSAFAPVRPWFTSSSTRVGRIATSANSAATKNPLTATKSGIATSPTIISERLSSSPLEASSGNVKG